MSLEQLVNYLDAGFSIAILLYILYRMEKGHAAAVARLWDYIDKLTKIEGGRGGGGHVPENTEDLPARPER